MDIERLERLGFERLERLSLDEWPFPPHVLDLEAPGDDGPNVGIAMDKHGYKYKFEGDVLDRKANGAGIQTWLTGDMAGIVFCGEFLNGLPHGPVVRKFPDGNCTFAHMVSEDFIAEMEEARQFFLHMRRTEIMPWTRKYNGAEEYKPFQEIIFTILVCANRLHKQAIEEEDNNVLCKRNESGSRLKPMPNELWELILSFFCQF
eukprot:m.73367 g.73367  ORF g.73367 m.73367 type:complete len:204 (+) comp12404_c0_seq1:227-838(+)